LIKTKANKMLPFLLVTTVSVVAMLYSIHKK
jgi:hypothetical protein